VRSRTSAIGAGHEAVRFEMRDASVARDERHGTREVLCIQVALHELVNVAQPLGGQTNVFGLRRRPGSTRRPGERGDEEQGEGNGSDSPPDLLRHWSPPSDTMEMKRIIYPTWLRAGIDCVAWDERTGDG
jgi:hypothetical protein